MLSEVQQRELTEQFERLQATALELVVRLPWCVTCRSEGRTPMARATHASKLLDGEPVCLAHSCVGDTQIIAAETLDALSRALLLAEDARAAMRVAEACGGTVQTALAGIAGALGIELQQLAQGQEPGGVLRDILPDVTELLRAKIPASLAVIPATHAAMMDLTPRGTAGAHAYRRMASLLIIECIAVLRAAEQLGAGGSPWDPHLEALAKDLEASEKLIRMMRVSIAEMQKQALQRAQKGSPS